MKKKCFLILGTVLMTALLFCCAGCAAEEPEVLSPEEQLALDLQNPQMQEIFEQLKQDLQSGDVTVEGMTIFAADSFDALMDASKLVVLATVTDSENIVPVTQTSTLTVNETFVGKEFSEIVLYQMAEDNAVQIGETYLLFLGEQYEGDASSNVFYPIGGAQGVMLVDEDREIVYTSDAKVADDALTDWIDKNMNQTSGFFGLFSKDNGKNYSVQYAQ